MSDPKRQLTLSTSGSADDLVQLLEWFNNDDELRGRVSLRQEPIRAGQMGGLYDVLAVALGSGGIGSALAGSLTGWFTYRRSDISVTLKLDGGTEITLDGKRITTPEVAEALQSMLGQLNKPQ